jgi:glycosyltransferase involved in cell wall biosynthesis
MASECCVVATPSGGVTEQLEDGRTGIVADRICGADLARALTQALADPERSQAIGRAARGHVIERFSLDLAVRRHLELYQTVLRS